MKKYVQSELLKNKKSFAVKMLVWIPIVNVILAVIMMAGNYVQVLAYNWWYLLFLPFVLSYVSAHLISNERKKNYHGLLSVLERKQNLVYGKIIASTLYSVVTNGVFFILMCIVGLVFENQISVRNNLLATVTLTLTFAWQIPFVMLLTQRMNAVIVTMVNVALNIGIACLLAEESTWWIPFAIPARAMCIILGILPNGLLAEEAFLFGNHTTIITAVLITVFLYGAMTVYCGKVFSKREV